MGRAVFSLSVALLVAALAIWMRDEAGAQPPVLVRLSLFAMSALLLWAAAANYLHVQRRRAVLAGGRREPADIRVSKEKMGDSPTYYARVEAGGEVWRVPLAGTKAVRRRVGFQGQGWIWRSADTGAPLAIEVEGALLETYPVPTRSNPIA
jgi:hypothetical protein